MSSELVVQALPTVQSPTHGATNGKSQVVRVAVLPDTATTKKVKAGKELPENGSTMPAVPERAGGSETTQNQDQPLSSREVLEAVQNLNDFVQKTRRELNFSVDELTGRAVVKVIDHETKKVIRQIPAEEVMQMARRVAEQSDEKGNLLKVEV
jgi:flagellar protein FlaG